MIPYGTDHTCPHGEPWGTDSCEPPEWWHAEQLLSTIRSGDWLDRQKFPALRWAVPGVVPEGFSLLVGPPKAGKSWLALAVLLAIACGGKALGRISVPEGEVLYLAMEDGDRRMQERCRHLMGEEPLPANFHYVTRVKAGQVAALIAAWLEAHPRTVLIVIDTLGKVMPPANPMETTYQRDYRIGGQLKAITDSRPGLSLVVVHHDRKASSDDFVDRVSGTNGLAGAADTIVVLSRARQSDDGILAVTGRDVTEDEYALTMLGGSWVLDGANLAEAAAKARERASVEGVGDMMADVVRVVNAAPHGIGPSEIAQQLKADPAKVKVYLGRALAAGRVDKLQRGLYVGVLPVTSVTSYRDSSMQGNEVTEVTPPMDDTPLWDDES